MEACLAATDREGVDIVVDAVGSALTKKLSLEAARPGGCVVWIGLHEDVMALDSYAITLPEKKVFGTYAATKAELETAVALMAARRVDMESWVSAFPLNAGVEAFHGVLKPEPGMIKVVLQP